MLWRRERFQPMRKLWIIVVVLILLVPATLNAQSRDDVRPLQQHVEAALDAARGHDVATLRRESEAIEASWAAIEDGVRGAHPDLYRKIEASLTTVQSRVAASPVDTAAVSAALENLEHSVDELAV